MLHPYMPFVTSEISERLTETMGGVRVALTYETEQEGGDERITGAIAGRAEAGGFLMSAPWPAPALEAPDAEAESRMALVQQVVGAVRQIKGEMGVPQGVSGTAHIRVPEAPLRAALEAEQAILLAMAALDGIRIGADLTMPSASGSSVIGALEVYLPLEGLIDLEVERRRLEKERARLEGLLKGAHAKLSNRQFMSRAPGEVVAREQAKQARKVEKLLSDLEA